MKYKKRVILLFIMLSIILASLPVLADNITEYVLYENTFDSGILSLEAKSNHHIDFTYSARLKTAKDGTNQGIASTLAGVAHTNRSLLFDFTKGGNKEGLNGGIYTLSFDFKLNDDKDSDDGTAYGGDRLASVVTNSVYGEWKGNGLMYFNRNWYNIPEKVVSNYTSWPTSGTECDTTKKTVKIEIDIDNNTATYYIDNVKTAEQMGVCEKLQNITIFLNNDIGFFDNVKLTAKYPYPTECIITSDKAGNIFYEDEPIELNLNVKNLESTTRTEDIILTVTDINGNIVSEEVKNITVAAQSETDTKIKSEVPFGVYYLTATSDSSIDFKTRIARSVKAESLNKKVNVSVHFGGRHTTMSIPTMFELLSKAGFGGVRSDFGFSIKTDDAGNVTGYSSGENASRDALISGSRKYGMDILALLPVDTSYYADDTDGGFNTSEEFLKGYYDFCYWLADKYKDDILYFEIGNEKNYVKKSDGTPDNGADYVKILEAAYDGIKKGNENAKVITTGSGIVRPDGYGGNGIYYAFNERKFAEGILGDMQERNTYKFDAYGVHPYHRQQPPETTMHWTTTKATWPEHANVVREYFTQFSIPDTKQAWVTETGLNATGPDVSGKIDERENASWLVRLLALNEIGGYFEKMFIYTGMNHGHDLSNKEDNFGMVCFSTDEAWNDRSAYAAKYQYLGVAQWNKLMADASFIKNTIADNKYTAQFKNENQDIFVLWDVLERNDAITVENETKAKQVVVYDMFGNTVQILYGVDTVTVHNVSGEPYYVVFSDSVLYAEENGTGIDFKAECVNGENLIFAVASYKDGRLLEVRTKALDKNGEAVISESQKQDGITYKLMILEDFVNLRPMIKSVEVK